MHVTYLTDPVIPSSNCVEHDIRLHPRGSQSEGYVQVCVNGAWGGICSGGISSGASHLMCAQLGYQPRGKINNVVQSLSQ